MTGRSNKVHALDEKPINVDPSIENTPMPIQDTEEKFDQEI